MEKKECWLSWSEFLESKSQANIILAGDLNINLAPNEKKGGNRGKDHIQDTVEGLIQFWELIDLKPKTRHFMWSNKRVGAAIIFARLDRFLVLSSLLDGKLIICTKILPKLSSDHHPIALVFENEDKLGPIPFRFCPLWIERDGFMAIVYQAWTHFVHGSPSFVWE